MTIRTLCLAAFACALAPSGVAAQDEAPAELSLEHRMLLRCSAAFALVATAQEAGNEMSLQYPPLAERGKEFFVRSAAEVMEAAGLDRAQINAALRHEARDLAEDKMLEEIMPVCLSALEASGL